MAGFCVVVIVAAAAVVVVVVVSCVFVTASLLVENEPAV